MTKKLQKKCVQCSPSDITKLQMQVCMNNEDNNPQHKMLHFVPQYNHFITTINGSAGIGIPFYGDI